MAALGVPTSRTLFLLCRQNTLHIVPNLRTIQPLWKGIVIMKIECQLDGHLRLPATPVWWRLPDKKCFDSVEIVQSGLLHLLRCTLSDFSEQDIWLARSLLKTLRKLSQSCTFWVLVVRVLK